MTLRKLLWTWALVLLVPGVAQASPLFEQAGDFGGTGGLSARVRATGAAATYFNPALLTEASTGMTLGVLVLRTELGISLDSRGGSEHDVPDGLGSASTPEGSRLPSTPIATSTLRDGRAATKLQPALAARPRQGAGTGHETLSYEAIGLVVRLRDRVTFGFYGLFPNKNFMRIRSFYVDEREQYFTNSLHPELYSDRLTALSVAAAVGVKLSKSFSLGVGATLGFKAGAVAPAFVADASQLQNILLNMNADVKMAVAPQVGLTYRPHPRLRLSATLHAPQKIQLDVGFKFLLANGLEQGSTLKFVQDYQPWQAGAGLTWDLLQRSHQTWSATASVLYGRWSKYLDRNGVRPGGAYAWNDTVGGNVGVQYVGARWGFGGDASYAPTPVPLQTGRTNYVDNDRFGLGLSAEYRWTSWELPFRASMQLQMQRLITRAQRKLSTPTRADGENRTPQRVWDEVPDDAVISSKPVAGREGLQTNNPGWPGFSSVGWVSSGGVFLSLYL